MPSKRGSRIRTARRPTLRTLVDRVKSSGRRERTRTSRPSASGTSRTRVANRQSTLAPRTVVVGTLCVVAAAALLMSRSSSIVNWEADVDASGNVQRLERVDSFDPAANSLAPAPENNSVSPRSSRPASTASEPAAKHVEPAPAAYEFAAPPASSPEPQARLMPASLRTTESEPEPASSPAPAEPAAAAVPATITGCLARDENTFWLKNVSGDDAPKSRSWKSGFLRKKSTSVELVDRGSTNRLAAYVGRKIETTGALTDHEMRVKTLRVLGACE